MKYGEVVKYTRNGEKLNAQVVQSVAAADGEHLTLVYLDPLKASPLMGGAQVLGAVATAFSVVPLKEGANNGWEHFQTVDLSAIDELNEKADEMEASIVTLQTKLGDAEAKIANLEAALNQGPEPAPEQSGNTMDSGTAPNQQ